MAGDDSVGGRHIEISGSDGVQVGNSNVQHNLWTEHATVLPPEALVPLTEVSATAGLTNPPVLSRRFVGRSAELRWLDGVDSSDGRRRVVHGLGGCGKTSLVARWLSQRAGSHNPVWWVTADNADNLRAGLASLARALHPGFIGLPVEEQAVRATDWLAMHDGWLLVLDNVRDPALVEPLLARLPAGRFLMTSRVAAGWRGVAEDLRLDVLPPDESAALAHNVLPDNRPADLDGIAAVCAELGHLPLAVEQAAAFLAETAITAGKYLDLLRAYPVDMYRSGGEGLDEERTVARVWAVTLDHLATDPLTTTVLRVLAWFDSRAIPRGLLDELGPPPAVLTAVRRLGAHSMIVVSDATLDVHRLVQAVSRTPGLARGVDDTAAIDDARTYAAAALRDALAGDPDDNPAVWPAWHALTPHALAFLSRSDPSADGPDTEVLAHRTGRFMRGQGRFATALDLAERATAAAARLYGDASLDTATRRADLAEAHVAAGDPGRALDLHRRALDVRAAALGPQAPPVLESRDRLAHAYLAAGETALAVEQHRQVLADLDRILGPAAAESLTAANDLVHAMLIDDPAVGLPVAVEVAERCERALGHDAPQTLTARHNLASAYVVTGEWATAFDLLAELVADNERILGADHPDSLQTRNMLATGYFDSGDAHAAIPILESVVAAADRVMGPRNRFNVNFRFNLGSAYLEVGDSDRGIAVLTESLAIRETVMGADLIDPRRIRGTLAGALIGAEAYDRAAPLLRHLVTADRPAEADEDWASHVTLLASSLVAVGAVAEGTELIEGLLRAENSDHMSRAAVALRIALGRLAVESGGPAGVVTTLRATLRDANRVFGAGTPVAVEAAFTLVRALRAVDDRAAAVSVLFHTMVACERRLGPTHPDTLAIQEIFAHEQVEAAVRRW